MVFYIETKILMAISLFIVVLFFGLLPLHSHSFSANKSLLSVSTCFSGGLFLALGLIHILPEAANLLGQPSSHAFPWNALIALLSFALVMFLDKAVFAAEDEESEVQHSTFKDNIEKAYCHRFSEQHGEAASRKSIRLLRARLEKAITRRHSLHQADSQGERESIPEERTHRDSLDTDEEIARLISEAKDETSSDRSVSAYMLLLAMGLHGIFAGLALGATTDQVQMVTLWLALILHKWSEALTVGVSFVSAGVKHREGSLLIAVLASLGPIGVFLGMYIATFGPIASGICMSISAGTLIYVATSEIIVEEFHTSVLRYTKFFAFFIGAAFIAAITYYECIMEGNSP